MIPDVREGYRNRVIEESHAGFRDLCYRRPEDCGPHYILGTDASVIGSYLKLGLCGHDATVRSKSRPLKCLFVALLLTCI
jgi:hypothetical protein